MQLIFDNAGGTTIQTETFAAHYTNAADAARDAMLIVGGGDTSDWESDEEARIDADRLDKWERAGAALSLQVADILAAKAEGVYASSWFNVRNFFRALGCSVSE